VSVDRPIPHAVAIAAQQAYHEAVADLLEAAVDRCANADVLNSAAELAALCRDAALLAEALDVLRRRSAP
jgi:hypothetical protein